MSKISDAVTALAAPIVAEENCSLWDVEFVKEAGGWFLRVYIDREGGVDIEDCVRISHRLDPILDAEDLIADSYTFEVCSAGVDRVLKRPSDFEAYMGSKVDVKLYKAVDGRKAISGTLSGYDDGNITLTVDENDIKLEKSLVSQVRLHVDF